MPTAECGEVNAQQKATAKGLALLVLVLFLVGLGALAIELRAVVAGGNSTISEAMWRVWADQPWIFFLITHVVAAVGWWLTGHFTGQSKAQYDALRNGVDLDLAVQTACRLRDLAQYNDGAKLRLVWYYPTKSEDKTPNADWLLAFARDTRAQTKETL